MNDLTNSLIDRRNILNNNSAIRNIHENIDFKGVMFERKYRFTKYQIANYFEVDIRTVDRTIEANLSELQQSGYEIFTGVRLKKFKEQIISQYESQHGNDKNVVTIGQFTDNEVDSLGRTSILATFTFKTFLNMGMLLMGSDKAQKLRSMVLDIVIDVLNKKLGGNTKFINQHDQQYLHSAMMEFDYRKEFTTAIEKYIEKNNFKYSQLTDKVYKSIFSENAKEYKQILKLDSKDNVRNTMYSEILDLVSSYENGYAKLLCSKYEELGRQLSFAEAHNLFNVFESQMDAFIQPLREKARTLMASRDLIFREVLHDKLESYIKEVSAEDFERFLGEQSITLEKRLIENRDVFQRLKNR